MRTHPKIRAAAEKITKTAGNAGMLIDIGWRSYAAIMLPDLVNASAPSLRDQREKYRYAYYSGAEHLFTSIMVMMDSDREPTASDLARMAKVNDEIEAFQRELEGYIALHMKTGGTA